MDILKTRNEKASHLFRTLSCDDTEERSKPAQSAESRGSNSAILVKEINNNMTESLKFLDEVGLTYGRLKISKSGH